MRGWIIYICVYCFHFRAQLFPVYCNFCHLSSAHVTISKNGNCCNSFFLGSCRTRATNGNCCVFPFLYKRRRYYRCTRRNGARPWCATTPSYDRDRLWSYCPGGKGSVMIVKTYFKKMFKPRLNDQIFVQYGVYHTKHLVAKRANSVWQLLTTENHLNAKLREAARQ